MAWRTASSTADEPRLPPTVRTAKREYYPASACASCADTAWTRSDVRHQPDGERQACLGGSRAFALRDAAFQVQAVVVQKPDFHRDKLSGVWGLRLIEV